MVDIAGVAKSANSLCVGVAGCGQGAHAYRISCNCVVPVLPASASNYVSFLVFVETLSNPDQKYCEICSLVAWRSSYDLVNKRIDVFLAGGFSRRRELQVCMLYRGDQANISVGVANEAIC